MGKVGGICELVRTVPLGSGMRGVWYLPDGQAVHTLEDDPLPTGTYLLRPDETGRFTHFVIERVPGSREALGRTNIEVHPGNTLAESRGCILPGLHTNPGGVSESRPALEVIRRALGRDLPEPPTWVLEIL